MKPEFSKPFNMEHARAGAPFCLRGGGPATVLKWDGRRKGEPLIGFRTEQDIPSSWSAGGVYFSDCLEGPDDLVMLPLGLIGGKPVFVGDQVVNAGGAITTAFVGIDLTSPPLAWRWPAPTKAYPTTSMTFDELAIVHNAQLDSKPNEFARSVRAVANAALRHAVDAGQVVPVSEARPGVRPHNPYTGALRDPRDVESDPMGVLIRHPDEPMHAAKDGAARDVTVARAVRDVCIAVIDRSHTRTARELLDIDLSAITQSVQ